MNFRFLQFPRTSLEHTLSDSGLDPRVPDLALLMQPIPLSEAGNENAYFGKLFTRLRCPTSGSCYIEI